MSIKFYIRGSMLLVAAICLVGATSAFAINHHSRHHAHAAKKSQKHGLRSRSTASGHQSGNHKRRAHSRKGSAAAKRTVHHRTKADFRHTGTTAASDTVSIVSAPTQVSANQSVSITVSYTTNTNSALVLTSPLGGTSCTATGEYANISSTFAVTPGSGTHTFTVAPASFKGENRIVACANLVTPDQLQTLAQSATATIITVVPSTTGTNSIKVTGPSHIVKGKKYQLTATGSLFSPATKTEFLLTTKPCPTTNGSFNSTNENPTTHPKVVKSTQSPSGPFTLVVQFQIGNAIAGGGSAGPLITPKYKSLNACVAILNLNDPSGPVLAHVNRKISVSYPAAAHHHSHAPSGGRG